jgi:hypothetical protein
MHTRPAASQREKRVRRLLRHLIKFLIPVVRLKPGYAFTILKPDATG